MSGTLSAEVCNCILRVVCWGVLGWVFTHRTVYVWYTVRVYSFSGMLGVLSVEVHSLYAMVGTLSTGMYS